MPARTNTTASAPTAPPDVERVEPKPRPGPSASTVVAIALLVVAIVLGAGAFAVVRALDRVRSTPLLPPATTSRIEVQAAPNVLLAMHDLARIETASFHMERVIQASDTQTQLWGLLEARDSLVLIASGEVLAGIDLRKLRTTDAVCDWEHRRIQLTLPQAEVFATAIDNQRTRIHQRDTEVLADRNEQLEGRARQEAETQLRRGALESGILERAQSNAERDLRALLRAMGFTDVRLSFREITETSR